VTKTDWDNLFSFGQNIGTFISDHPWYALLIVFSVVSIYILSTWTLRPSNRARLRALIGPNYNEGKSVIGIANSISVDDKSGRFGIISDDREFLCAANEILSAEFTSSSKTSVFATLAIEMAGEAHPKFEISVLFFREDKLREVHRLLKVLQKQDRAPQHQLEEQAAFRENDRLVHAIERLNCSIVMLTEVAKTISDELQHHRIGQASRQSGASNRGQNNDVGKE
jgi:hypothetical protein